MAIRRLQILQAIQTRLNTLIDGTNGYYTDLRNKVFVFRTDAFQAHEMPGLNITRGLNDFTSELVAREASKHNQVLSVDVDLICENGKMSHELAEKIIADIYKAIGTGTDWNGLAYDTVPITDEVGVDRMGTDAKNVKIIGGGRVSFTVYYSTKQFQES